MRSGIRILQVSDSHLSRQAPHADENWLAVVEHARATRPDLVVHTGDVTLDGASSATDLEHARALVDRLPVPWLTVPGNHDIGDVGDTQDPVTAARTARYGETLGETSWTRSVGGWQLVGVDLQTLLADLPSTEPLWEWLESTLDGSSPTALFLHRPLVPLATDHVDEPSRYVTEPGRGRLMQLLAAGDVRLVASGHVHQWQTADVGPVRHVWAPSTWAALPDRIQPVLGRKVVGVVEHTLYADGQSTSVLVQPEGVRQLVIADDFESPYSH
ncbi:MAG TPA: metallophosphoesterase [Ilumatobacter sp.]|nr:metallophosphoesterase [Ilumatobacter sp.]